MSTRTHRCLAAAIPLALALVFLSSCKQGSDPDPALPGGLAVVSVDPSASDGPIRLDTTFYIAFDKDLDQATTDQGLSLTMGGTPVAARVFTFVSLPKVLILDPAEDLIPGAAYTLEAVATLRATDGSSLPAAVRRDYVALDQLTPPLSVSRASYAEMPLSDGAWTNEDLCAGATRSASQAGGTLSILWSTDGSTWTESESTSSSRLSGVNIATVDDSVLRVKARCVYQGATYESDVLTLNIDKTEPRVLSCESPAAGKLEIVMSEPIYKSQSGDTATATDFQLQSVEYLGAQFTITAVSGSGANWTIDYTYRGSNGDHIQIIAAGMDLAGNRAGRFATAAATIKAPTVLQASVASDGSISAACALGSDFGDGFVAAVSTTDTDNGLTWTASVGGAPVAFSGLDLETRYYVRAASTLGTIGRSKVVRLSPSYRGYLYPVQPFNEGSGTEDSPWLIRNRADLEGMLDDEAMCDDYFRLAADLDLSRYEWHSVYNSSTVEFSGDLDGAGYSITGGTAAPWSGGIIEDARGASIHDLVVRNARITGYLFRQGVIANLARGSTSIERTAVEGFELTASGSCSGGIVGLADPSTVIRGCYAQGRVIDSSQGRVGGIAGNTNGATIEDCFAAVDIAGSDGDYCAGLVGEAYAGTIVRRAFASGAIDTDQDGAGLVGISSTYANRPVLDSLIAMNPSLGKAGYESTLKKRYRAIYADIAGSGYPLSDYAAATNVYANSAMTVDGATVADSDVNGTGMTLAAFKASASPCFTGWDFAATWIMTTKGPSLRNMPLGGGNFGTPAIDPVGWD